MPAPYPVLSAYAVALTAAVNRHVTACEAMGLYDPQRARLVRDSIPIDAMADAGVDVPRDQLQADWEFVFLDMEEMEDYTGTRKSEWVEKFRARISKVSVEVVDVLIGDQECRNMSVSGCFANLAENAAAAGRLDIVERLYAYYRCGYGDRSVWRGVTEVAIETGHIDILRFIFDCRYVPDLTTFAVVIAAETGQCAAMTYLRGRGAQITKATTIGAAEHGQLQMLELLRGWGVTIGPGYARVAAHAGHLDVVRRLHEWGIDCNSSVADKMARKGKHEMLELLHECGVECTSEGARRSSAATRELLAGWGIYPPNNASANDSDDDSSDNE